MPSTYSTNLALELIGTGDQAGTWGSTTNTNLGTLIEQAISGYVTQAITDGADTVITIPNGASGVARNMFIECTGALTAARNLIVPSNKKLYFIYNNTTGGYAVTVKVSGQTGVSVPAGAKALLVCNGTDIVVATNYLVAPILGTPASGTLTNCTGLPVSTGVSGLGTGVATALGSNANATGGLATTDGTATLTNKRIDPRVSSTATGSSLTPDISAYDVYAYTALAGNLTINAGTGTPVDGDKLVFRVLDNGTTRTITFTGGVSGGFRPIGPPLTVSGSNFTYATTANKTVYFGCVYNANASRWDVVALSQEA